MVKINKKGETDKKEKIIESAFKILNRKTYYKSPVDEIANNAKIAKGTVYLYFKSKEEIYFSVFFSLISKIKEITEEVQKSEIEPAKQLYVLLVKLSAFIGKNRNIFLALRENMSPLKGKTHLELHGKFDEIIQSISKIVGTGIKRKEFRSYPPEIVSAIFISLTSVIAHHKIEHNSKNAEVMTRIIFDIFLKGINR